MRTETFSCSLLFVVLFFFSSVTRKLWFSLFGSLRCSLWTSLLFRHRFCGREKKLVYWTNNIHTISYFISEVYGFGDAAFNGRDIVDGCLCWWFAARDTAKYKRDLFKSLPKTKKIIHAESGYLTDAYTHTHTYIYNAHTFTLYYWFKQIL